MAGDNGMDRRGKRMGVFRTWSTENSNGSRADKVSERVARQMVNDVIAQKLEPGSLLASEALMIAWAF